MIYIEQLNKEEFIDFAKKFNIFKSIKFPQYLAIKDAIIKKLPDHNLTIDDIRPDVRECNYNFEARMIKWQM